MSVLGDNDTIALLAAGDYSAKYGFAVKITSETVATLAGAGEQAIGILTNRPESGKPAEICIEGGCKASAGANNLAVNDKLKVDSNGELVLADTDKDYYICRALEASTAVHDLISVVMEKGYISKT